MAVLRCGGIARSAVQQAKRLENATSQVPVKKVRSERRAAREGDVERR